MHERISSQVMGECRKFRNWQPDMLRIVSSGRRGTPGNKTAGLASRFMQALAWWHKKRHGEFAMPFFLSPQIAKLIV
jgi:hypothetical protein